MDLIIQMLCQTVFSFERLKIEMIVERIGGCGNAKSAGMTNIDDMED